jgi:cytosine/adenosine deaminase-related metal-dependent hydrolase
MDGAPIENGAVAVSGNRIDDSLSGPSPSRAARLCRAAPAGSIVDVGKFDQIKKDNAGEIVDLGEQALLPGLINAHCHLDYTCLRGKIPPQRTFADWIRAINAEKEKLSPKDYLSSINKGFAEAKRFGTTTVANLTAFPDLIPQIHAPIRTWWFAELIDVRAPKHANEIVDLVRRRTDSLRRAIESLRSLECADTSALLKRSRSRGIAALQTQHWGLAPHALFTASENLYERCEEIARRENVLLTTHLAESREEMEMFRDASGPLYEFLKSIGRPMDDCGNETPLGLFLGAPLSRRAGCDRALPQWIVAHLNELTGSDFDMLENAKGQFHVAHCPRSHGYFKHSQFPFERLHSLGFNICLGTDSLASNENLSLFAEMRAFQRSEPGISPDEILEMVTVNPAMALHQENMIGRIRPGFCADLIAIPCSQEGDLFEEIVGFDGEIDWVMVNGDM